jgi:hypothetical protein
MEVERGSKISTVVKGWRGMQNDRKMHNAQKRGRNRQREGSETWIESG